MSARYRPANYETRDAVSVCGCGRGWTAAEASRRVRAVQELPPRDDEPTAQLFFECDCKSTHAVWAVFTGVEPENPTHYSILVEVLP